MLPLQVKVDLGAMAIEWVLHIPQSFRSGALPSDCLVSYPGYSLVGSYFSAEVGVFYSLSQLGCKTDWKWLLDK